MSHAARVYERDGNHYFFEDIEPLLDKLEYLDKRFACLETHKEKLREQNEELKLENIDLRSRMNNLKQPKTTNIDVFPLLIDKKYIDQLRERVETLEKWCFGSKTESEK